MEKSGAEVGQVCRTSTGLLGTTVEIVIKVARMVIWRWLAEAGSWTDCVKRQVSREGLTRLPSSVFGSPAWIPHSLSIPYSGRLHCFLFVCCKWSSRNTHSIGFAATIYVFVSVASNALLGSGCQETRKAQQWGREPGTQLGAALLYPWRVELPFLFLGIVLVRFLPFRLCRAGFHDGSELLAVHSAMEFD